ncbi:TALPID3 protein-like [Diadema setosum]|uniref:TALPID3 protein-like n=1 Tax=Diadema setosum TaxID=31175 RepID=UPI003B3A80D4
MERRRQAWLGPAPLDEYLRRNQDAGLTQRLNPLPLPTSKLPMSPSRTNAPVVSPLCAEAQALLRRVQSSREVLEANLEAVDRARDGEHFYQAIHDMCMDGNASDLAWIKHAVDRHISAIDSEIKREIRQGKVEQRRLVGHRSSPPHLSPGKPGKASQPSQPPDDRQKPARKPGKPIPAASAPGKVGKARVQAKIDTGLRQARKQEPRAEVKGQDANILEQDKENLPKKKGDRANTSYQDHLRPYGGPLGHDPRLTPLQPLRSTLKDAPYLHFANQTPTKGKRPVAHLASPIPVKEQKAAQTQTKSQRQHHHGQSFQPGPQNQYFFHPYSIQEVAGLTSIGPQPAPAHGQLVPMAVPLGKPRTGIGLPRPVTIRSGGREGEEMEAHPTSQQPAKSNTVEERANVAVVEIKVPDEKPKLAIQHLPNVDIETAPPTPASSQEDANQSVTPQVQHHDDNEEEEEEEEDPDDAHWTGSTGIALQGVTERQPSYHGPVFPPRQPPPTEPVRVVSSDQLAAGISHRELLQNRAVEWVEQELMAKMISEMYFRRADLPPTASRERQRSVSPVPSEEDEDLHAMGGGGLQLFVDAGQAVDPALVSGLVQEVLEEKIALCLGQREQERSSLDLTHHSQDERQPSPHPVRQRSPLQTPSPTPPASPIPQPFREPSPTPRDRILTPEASIEGDVEVSSCAAESETESLKDLVHDQAASKEAATIALPGPSAVVTPPTTPPPIRMPSPQNFLPDGDAPTPQPSPRGTPTPLEAPLEPMATPTCTPEPQSPTTPEPEEDTFRETPLPPSPEPREPSPLPPAPSPSPPPKPATPAPDSVESSSSTTTTETTPQDSTTTQSTGREISEGEWLISKSEEGRVPDETLFDVPEMEAFEESSQSSSTSTIKASIDPDKDQEDPRSEGEVHPSKMRLTRDPVVALLARLHQGIPGPEVAVPPAVTQPSAVSSPLSISSGTVSSSSVGEVSEGQRPSLQPPAEHMLYQRAYHSQPPQQHGIGHGASNEDVPSTDEDGEVKDGEGRGIKSGRHPGVVKVAAAANVSDSSTGGTPMQSRYRDVAPVVPTPVARVITVGGGSDSGSGEEEEAEESVGHPDRDMPEADMNTPSVAFNRDRPPPPSLFSTMASDPGTRTMTPDAMNMDALLKSGYLSQTFSQTEGDGGTMSEGSALFAQIGNSGFNASGTIPRGSSHLATSGMFSEDSLEVAVGGSHARAREQRSFQVTLPSIASPDGQEAGESLSEGELNADDSISDVSEMTL